MGRVQEIRANYDREIITVYQAYGKAIALPAIQNNKFETPFSFHRMTWIKPSYLWLMARSNWGTKSNQEYILAIKITRAGWEKALSLGVLTDPDKAIYKSGSVWKQAFENAKVHIQWDPERTLKGAKMDIRSIQVGIGRDLIKEYNEEWIQEIVDLTPLTRKIKDLIKKGKYKEAKRLVPDEKVYAVSESIQQNIGIR